MAEDVRKLGPFVRVSQQVLDDAPPLDLLAYVQGVLSGAPPADRPPRPCMQAALLYTALRRCAEAEGGLAVEVLALHRPPVDLDPWAECQGCGGYDDGVPWTACPTVGLLCRRYLLEVP